MVEVKLMQSHGGQVRHFVDSNVSCDDVTDSAHPARFARRPLLKAAVFGPAAVSTVEGGPDAASTTARTPVTSGLVHTVTGTVLDVSPHVLVLQTVSGEERFTLAGSTTAWRGGPVAPAALRHGDTAIVRRKHGRRTVAERIWSDIGRTTGTIIEKSGNTLLVDEGIAKARKIVVIPEQATGRIQVRFPRLQPGYLIDVIGLRHQGFLEGLVPATSQPPYRADHPPAPPLVNGHVPDPVSGTAVWHEPGEEPDDLLGVAYPALDPETGCESQARSTAYDHFPRPRVADDYSVSGSCNVLAVDRNAVDPHLAGPGCVRLPYLSVGSVLRIRSDCTRRARLLPVTSCGATARLFCDRCVTCGTSPRGRIADLTIAAFVELGGDLDVGCFNATMTVGG
jgi:hypothetical protein